MIRFTKKRGIFANILLSYLFVLVIPTLLGILLMVQSIRFFASQEDRYHQTILEQVKSDLDTTMGAILDISYQISLNDHLSSLLVAQNEFEESQMHDLYLLQQDLKKLQAEHPFIKNLYLYFLKTDTILIENNHIPKDMFYQLYLKPLNLDRSSWQAAISDTSVGNIGTFSVRENNVDGTVVYFMQSIPNYSATHVNLVMELDQQEIFNETKGLNFSVGDELTIYGQSDQTLLSSNPKRYLSHAKGNLSASRYCYQVNSDILPIRYMTLFSPEIAGNKIKQQILIGVLGWLAIFGAGFALLYFFSRRNYRPIQQFLQKIPSNGKRGGNLGEYPYLQRALDEMESVRFIKLLLQGDTAGYPEFRHPKFLLLLAEAPDEEREPLEEGFRRMMKAGISLTYSQWNRWLIGIFNLEEGQREAVKKAIAEQMQPLSPHARISVSALYDQTAWDEGYRQAQNGLHQLEQTQKQLLFCEKEEKLLLPYPEELKQQCVELFVTGQEELLQQMLEKIDRDAFVPQKEVLEDFLYQVLALATDRMEADSGILFRWKLQPYRQMEKAKSAKEKIRVFLSLVSQAEALLLSDTKESKERKENRQEQIAERVKAYLDKNFSNQEINVYGIGGEFDLSPYYVSKIFKETTGMTILRYLDLQRIESAKTLLLQNISLASVAEQCGYTDSHALIRAFKKQMGMTPGRYKEMNQPHEEN